MRIRSRASLVLAFAVATSWMAVVTGPALGATTFVVNRIGDAADNNLADAKCDTSSVTGKQCTLRAAIQEANDTVGADTINFNITSASKVIAPATPLPPLIEQVTINGYSQSGAIANTQAVGSNAVLKIVLDGINAGPGANGLEVAAYRALVTGLVIMRFDGSGVLLSGTKSDVAGNYIGTNAAGTAARGNGVGVTVTGDSNGVGGGPDQRNLISGNDTDGIAILGASATAVAGNYIGTTKSGTVALGNGGDGVRALNAFSTFIGGSTSGARFNVISANGQAGVNIDDPGVDNKSQVIGNLIGTDATGANDLGNAGNGVRVFANEVIVGSTNPDFRNVISGNGGDGVSLFNTERNLVQGNYIGTNIQGTVDLGNDRTGVLAGGEGHRIGGSVAGARNLISGNGQSGVLLLGSAHTVQGNYIGTNAAGNAPLGNDHNGIKLQASNANLIGGSSAESNLVANNVLDGIYVFVSTSRNNEIKGNVVRLNGDDGIDLRAGPNTVAGNVVLENVSDGIEVSQGSHGVSGVTITANQVFNNGRLGINIAGGTENAAGVTANDTADPDTGANELQNFPILVQAVRSSTNGVTTVAASLNSNPSTQFRIELFVAVADASGHGEGQVLWAAQNVTTNSSGNRGFTFQVGGLSQGQVLTATATSVTAGNTSEFSANVPVVAGP